MDGYREISGETTWASSSGVSSLSGIDPLRLVAVPEEMMLTEELGVVEVGVADDELRVVCGGDLSPLKL